MTIFERIKKTYQKDLNCFDKDYAEYKFNKIYDALSEDEKLLFKIQAKCEMEKAVERL